jgi:beta-galactosidase
MRRSWLGWSAVLVTAACGHGSTPTVPDGGGEKPFGDASIVDGPQPGPGDGGDGATVTPDAPVVVHPPPASNRAELDLDDGWKFMRADVPGAEAKGFDDGAWASIRLPHTWNAKDGQDGGGDYYRGTGWYRRRYTLPAAYAGRRLYLQFEGANSVAEVWVNGMRVGTHRGGFATFRFDVTAAVQGENVIAVKVNNALAADLPPLSGDFTLFGGLYRDVHLLVTDPLHVDVEDFGSSGVYLTPRKVSAASAELEARIGLKNSDGAAHTAAVEVVVSRADGSMALKLTGEQALAPGAKADLTLSGTVDHPRLWDGRRDPYLYSVQVVVREGDLVRDAVVQPLGFRFQAVDPQAGFSLNGHPLDLHGVNRHQDRLDQGWALTAADQDQDMALIAEVGATAVRLAHYQHAQHVYDLCDASGLVVWAELGLVNNVTTSDAFTMSARQQLSELIRQSYNHPSIVFWSLANELSPRPDPNPLLTALNALAHSEDPGRLTALATRLDDSDPMNWRADVIGFNKYYGWYLDQGPLSDFAPWADGVHAAYPGGKVAVSEYGAGASVRMHAARPMAGDHTEEYQALFHEAYWKVLAARPYIWGKFIWNMFDFASDGRDEGDGPGRNDKGLVTYDRLIKKDAFFFYKASWSRDPFVHITGRRFEPRTGPTIDVKVYSNAPTVSLTVNGQALPDRISEDHIFLWPGVPLQPGANRVEAAAGASRDTVTWTRTP